VKFVKVDQLTSEWFSRAYTLSFGTESELSFWQELTWERWRISGNIPKKFLIYSKVEVLKQIFLFIFLLLILILFYFLMDNEQHFINGFGICLSLFLSFIVYLLITKIFIKKRKTELILPRLNFND
jgi:hypothetical protein